MPLALDQVSGNPTEIMHLEVTLPMGSVIDLSGKESKNVHPRSDEIRSELLTAEPHTHAEIYRRNGVRAVITESEGAHDAAVQGRKLVLLPARSGEFHKDTYVEEITLEGNAITSKVLDSENLASIQKDLFSEARAHPEGLHTEDRSIAYIGVRSGFPHSEPERPLQVSVLNQNEDIVFEDWIRPEKAMPPQFTAQNGMAGVDLSLLAPEDDVVSYLREALAGYDEIRFGTRGAAEKHLAGKIIQNSQVRFLDELPGHVPQLEKAFDVPVPADLQHSLLADVHRIKKTYDTYVEHGVTALVRKRAEIHHRASSPVADSQTDAGKRQDLENTVHSVDKYPELYHVQQLKQGHDLDIGQPGNWSDVAFFSERHTPVTIASLLEVLGAEQADTLYQKHEEFSVRSQSDSIFSMIDPLMST